MVREFKGPKKFDLLEKNVLFSEIIHILIEAVTLTSIIHIWDPPACRAHSPGHFDG